MCFKLHNRQKDVVALQQFRVVTKPHPGILWIF
jgi:hypothetical protein